MGISVSDNDCGSSEFVLVIDVGRGQAVKQASPMSRNGCKRCTRV